MLDCLQLLHFEGYDAAQTPLLQHHSSTPDLVASTKQNTAARSNSFCREHMHSTTPIKTKPSSYLKKNLLLTLQF